MRHGGSHAAGFGCATPFLPPTPRSARFPSTRRGAKLNPGPPRRSPPPTVPCLTDWLVCSHTPSQNLFPPHPTLVKPITAHSDFRQVRFPPPARYPEEIGRAPSE